MSTRDGFSPAGFFREQKVPHYYVDSCLLESVLLVIINMHNLPSKELIVVCHYVVEKQSILESTVLHIIDLLSAPRQHFVVIISFHLASPTTERNTQIFSTNSSHGRLPFFRPLTKFPSIYQRAPFLNQKMNDLFFLLPLFPPRGLWYYLVVAC